MKTVLPSGRATPSRAKPTLRLTLLLALLATAGQGRAEIVPSTTHPKDANVSLGGTITFSAPATSDDPPLNRQWQHNGTNLEGATNVQLKLTNITVLHGGTYRALLADAAGHSATSRVATLTINSFIQATKEMLGDDGFLKTDSDGPVPCWLDYDGDGWFDILFARGWMGDPRMNELYRNDRDGTFSRVTNALTRIAGKWQSGAAPTAADFDNDGDLDFVMVQWPPLKPILFVSQFSQGVRDFIPVPLAAGLGFAASFADLEDDGWADLAVTAFAGAQSTPSALLHNAGGQFQVITNTPFARSDEYLILHNWVDYDEDGDIDFWGGHTEKPGWRAALFQNQGDGTLTRVADHVLIETPSSGSHACWGDYDNDGHLDALVLFGSSHPGVLYRNLGGGEFEADSALPALQGLDYGEWVDYDNDGDLDLYGTGGTQPSRLFANDGMGRLTELLTCPTHPNPTARYPSWADYNNDGFEDLLLMDFVGPAALFQNNLPQTGNTNHWLKIQLKGLASNPNGLGAKIRVKATIGGKSVWQMRQVGVHWLPVDLLARFGLGDATTVDVVRIEWPSGNVQELTYVTPDQLLTVKEVVGIAPDRPSASLNGAVLLRSTTGSNHQWRFEGVDLAGQTNRTLALTNLTAAQQGRYSVVARNSTGTATNFVYLHVDTTFTKITTGPQVTDLGSSWGASWGDYDGDGFADLFVARNTNGLSALYHNNRDGTFARVSNAPFPQTADAWGSGAWADFDHDGRQDLVAARWGKPGVVYCNNGDGTFETLQLDGAAGWGVAVADYDRDGRLDILLSTGVSAWEAKAALLYRNNGNRTFTRMTTQEVGAIATIEAHGAATWADYDDDGWMDLYHPNGRGDHRLFHNEGTGRFVSFTNLVTQTAPAISGAWGDYDNDGRLDLCAAVWEQATSVYRNQGRGDFERADIGQNIKGAFNSTSWADFDNDGFLDLFVTSYFGKANMLYRNNGDGTFSRITTGSLVTDLPGGEGATDEHGSYSALWFDYDNDGFLDLYVSNGDDPAAHKSANFLYRNNGNANAWLKIKPVGTASNRDGVGAKVRAEANYAGEVRWQRRDISAGDGYNGNHLYAHFGLGNATNVTTLRIEWPSGMVQELVNVAANQILTIWEPPALKAVVQPDGACALNIRAEPNRDWEIQASNDLLSWETLATVKPTTMDFQYGDTAAAGMECRFYRVISPE